MGKKKQAAVPEEALEEAVPAAALGAGEGGGEEEEEAPAASEDAGAVTGAPERRASAGATPGESAAAREKLKKSTAQKAREDHFAAKKQGRKARKHKRGSAGGDDTEGDDSGVEEGEGASDTEAEAEAAKARADAAAAAEAARLAALPKPPLPLPDEALLLKREGFLYKKGSSGKRKFARKFFRLPRVTLAQEDVDAGVVYELQYFSSKDGAPAAGDVPKGGMSLDWASIQVHEMPSDEGKKRKKKGAEAYFTFDVYAADGQQFELGAETAEERDAWVSTIQALISAYEESRAAFAQLHQDSELQSASDAQHASALNCHSFGAGLHDAMAGEVNEFSICLYDHFEQPRIVEAGDLEVVLSSDALCYTNVEGYSGDPESRTDPELQLEQRAGDEPHVWTVRYRVTRRGCYELHVTLESFPIFGSPYALTVAAARPHAHSCVVSGKGLTRARADGGPNHFQVVLRDRFENLVDNMALHQVRCT